MQYLLQYLIKFSISLAVLYVFYRAVLRPLTFYQWNRFYLLGYSLLCFAIPFTFSLSRVAGMREVWRTITNQGRDFDHLYENPGSCHGLLGPYIARP